MVACFRSANNAFALPCSNSLNANDQVIRMQHALMRLHAQTFDLLDRKITKVQIKLLIKDFFPSHWIKECFSYIKILEFNNSIFPVIIYSCVV